MKWAFRSGRSVRPPSARGQCPKNQADARWGRLRAATRLPNLLRRAWARCRRPPQGRPGRKRPFFAERKQIVELAVKYRLPAIYFQKEFVDEGGLMSYGVDFDDLFRRAGHYVDKILKGTKPGDLPVQQATKFEFVINLKAAKQIGLTLSPEFLSRANKVIK